MAASERGECPVPEPPDLSIYRPAVTAYLADVRALAKIARERAGQQAYAKALDAAEERHARIPYAPSGAGHIERALKALRKATNECQAAVVRYDRAVAVEVGTKRLDRRGGIVQDVERVTQERQTNEERLWQAGETIRVRIEQVEALLAPSPEPTRPTP